MMNFKKKLVLVLPLLVTTACFNLEPQKRVVEESSLLGDDAKYDLVPIGYGETSVSTKAAVLNFRAVGRTYESLTGVLITSLIPGQDPSVLNDMPNYSLDSQPESINSAMELSLLRLGAGMCNQLVRKEMGMTSATRKFFKQFNFAAASEAQNISAAIADSANALSKAFCGVDATRMVKDSSGASTSETVAAMLQRLVVDSFDLNDNNVPTSGIKPDVKDNRATGGASPKNMYGANNYINTGDAAVMTCTALLSSSCTLVNN